MKLVAKAKPVKIRINSGGEEHSSLDSLKMNFCISDVKELLDGRLSRWLRQQNEGSLAEDVDKFKSEDLKEEEGILAFIRLFFCEELQFVNITSLFDVAVYWLTQDTRYRRNGELLFCPYLLENNLNAAKYAYKNGYFPEMCWGRIFMVHKGGKDPEALYILGKMYFEGSYGVIKNLDEGYRFIKEAAAYGWEEAVKFELDKVYQKVTDRFYGVNKNKIEENVIAKWPYQLIQADYKYASNEKEKEIIRFLFICKDIFKDLSSVHSPDFVERVAKKNSYLLGYETTTIYSIVMKPHRNIDRTELEPIKDLYPTAASILYQETLLGVNFYSLSAKNKIAFIVKNLFNF